MATNILWVVRAMWLALPLICGPGLADLLADRTQLMATGIEVAAWVGWFAGLVAWLVPSPQSLTVVRMLAPLLPAGLAIGLTAVSSPAVWIGLAGSVIVTLVVFSPIVGDPMVDASSYGPERRFALRPPAGALLAAPLLWVVAALGLAAGPVLLMDRLWLAGGVALVIGWPLAVRIGLGLGRLSHRWLVFVPAGMVMHDRQLLAEPVLVPRVRIDVLGPATEDQAERLDLTGGARGLSLALVLGEPLCFGVRDGRNTNEIESDQFVFTPSLPARVIHQARVRGVKTG